MFGLLYQECLQTGPLVFIWIFHFILPHVIRLFRVYSEWWIVSFTPLHSLKTCWIARACPKGAEYVHVCVVYSWVEIMAPRVCDRCLISLHYRQHLYNQFTMSGFEGNKSWSLPQFSTIFLQKVDAITQTRIQIMQSNPTINTIIKKLSVLKFAQGVSCFVLIIYTTGTYCKYFYTKLIHWLSLCDKPTVIYHPALWFPSTQECFNPSRSLFLVFVPQFYCFGSLSPLLVTG